MPDDEKRGIAGVTTLIPQVFFDLIGRVVPGSVTMAACVIAVQGPDRALASLTDWIRTPPQGTPTLLIVLVTLMIGYALAVALYGVWSIVAGALRIREATGATHPDGDFSLRYDFIKFRNPEAGNRITKLHAEIHLTSVLMTGLLTASLMNLGWMAFDPSAARIGFAVLLAAGALGCIGSWIHLRSRLRTAVDNQCTLLDYSGWRETAGLAPPQEPLPEQPQERGGAQSQRVEPSKMPAEKLFG